MVLAAILLGSVPLHLFGSTQTALWNDEAFSFFAARAGVAHTLAFIADDTQPPLYYLLLGLWLHLGHSVFVIRALSAVAITLAILPTYAAARRLFGTQVGLLTALLFTLSPLMVTWSQRARPYPVQTLLVAVCFWGFVRVFLSPEFRRQGIGCGLRAALKGEGWDRAGVDAGWAAYSVGGALAMLAQEPAGFFVLGCNAAVLIEIIRDRRAARLLLRNWIAAQVVLILIWMAWLPAFLRQVTQHLTPAQIASRHDLFLVSFANVCGTLQGLFSVHDLYRTGPVFAAVYGATAVFACCMIARRCPRAWFLPVVILMPVAVCLAAFLAVHPVFGYVISTFAWMTVPYTALIAFGLSCLPRRSLFAAALGVVLMGNVWGLRNAFQTTTPPLDKVAAAIAADLRPGDGLILGRRAAGRWSIAYYLGPPYEGQMVGLSVHDWEDADRLLEPDAARHLARVWIVSLPDDPPAIDPASLADRMQPALDTQIGLFHVQRLDAKTL